MLSQYSTPRAPRGLATPSSARTTFARTPASGHTPRRVPGSARVKPRERVVHENDRHLVEVLSEFPPIANQALLASEDRERAGGVTEDGWAWLVIAPPPLAHQGASLYVWHCIPSALALYEEDCLTVHLSDDFSRSLPLVALRTQSNGVVSAFLVSSEGRVCYYHTLVPPLLPVETTLSLKGKDEATHIVALPDGVLVGTKQSNLTLIVPSTVSASPSIRMSAISSSAGLFSGLTSYFRSPASTNLRALRKLPVSPGQTSEVAVMTETQLSVWNISSAGSSQLWSCPLLDLVLKEVLAIEPAPHEYLSRLVDCARSRLPIFLAHLDSSSDRYFVLFAFMDAVNKKSVKYSVHELKVDTSVAPKSPLSPFSVVASSILPYDVVYDASKIDSLFESVNLMLPRGGPASFIVWRNAVVSYQLPRDLRPLDLIPFNRAREPILSVGIGPDDACLLLSPAHGVVAVSHRMIDAMLPVDNAHAATHTYQEILREAFARYEQARGEPTSDVALLVEPLLSKDANAAILHCALSLVDALPMSDKRWKDAQRALQSSLLVQRQLANKMEQYATFVKFLEHSDLLVSLTPKTRASLALFGERIAAAYHVRQVYQTSEGQGAFNLVTRAIGEVLRQKGVTASTAQSKGLDNSDLFFAHTTEIGHLCDPLVALLQADVARFHESAGAASQQQASDDVAAITRTMAGVARVLAAMFGSAFTYRSTNAALFFPESAAMPESFELTWVTSEPVRRALATVLHLIQSHFGQCGALLPETSNDQTTRATAFHELSHQHYHLACALLLSFWDETAFRKTFGEDEKVAALEEECRAEAAKCVPVHLKRHEWNEAQSLAEQFCHFPSLVEFCEVKDDRALLIEYLHKYSYADFPAFVFNYFVQTGNIAALMDLPSDFWPEMSTFLDAHPRYSWIHAMQMGDAARAGQTLSFLASATDVDVFDRKLFLSLAKLARHAPPPPLPSDISLQNSQISTNDPREEQMLRLVYMQEELAERMPEISRSKPLTAKALVHALTRPARNPTVADFQLACDVTANATLLQREDETLKLIVQLFAQVISLTDWNSLDRQRAQGTLRDDEVTRMLRGTPFFEVAAHPSAREILSESTLAKVIELVNVDSDFVRRALASVLDMAIHPPPAHSQDAEMEDDLDTFE